MINNIHKVIAVMAILALLVSAAAGGVITQNIEIRGAVANGTTVYDYTNFAGFWYDIDEDRGSESLNVSDTDNRTIESGSLIYTCEPFDVDYENGELGSYMLIGFMANDYICYDDRADKLVKLLIEWSDSDDKALSMDDPMTFPEGYSLNAQEIDLNGDKVVLSLYKDGKNIDTEIIEGSNTYKYYDDDDVLVFSCKIDTVFRGTASNLVVVKYVFLRSEEIIDIDGGDAFGAMEVTSTSGGITMSNDDAITLDSGSDIDIMGELYFKVADRNDLRYYLAKKTSLDCPECPTVEPCPEQTPCPPCINATPEVVIEYVNVTDVDVPAKKDTPGFEAVFALVGLLAVAYLVLRQRE
jgi:S-layer protein (TIGR01567 family)